MLSTSSAKSFLFTYDLLLSYHTPEYAASSILIELPDSLLPRRTAGAPYSSSVSRSATWRGLVHLCRNFGTCLHELIEG